LGGQESPPHTHTIHVHEHEAGGVPYLVGEIPIAFGAAWIERDIRSRRRHRREREARRVRPVLLDDFDRIKHVALGLRHLLTLSVAHQSMDVDFAEWDAVAE